MWKLNGLEHRLRRGSLKTETSNARCPIIPGAPLNAFLFHFYFYCMLLMPINKFPVAVLISFPPLL